MNSPLIRLLVASAVLGGTPMAFALRSFAETDPARVLRDGTDEVLAVVYDKPADARPMAARMQPVMEKFFSFEAMTRRAVGPRWKQLSAAQQHHITALLTELVVRNYCAHFDPTRRSQITYAAPVELSADRRELPTKLTHGGQNYSVTYRAERAGDTWQFYDVIVEGVSLVANYRAQFDALFQKGGADAIVRALEQKLAEPASPS